MTQRYQKLPANGPERELLREKGQFWTPDWVAQAMVWYVTADGRDSIFDPAVGAGAFFAAAKRVALESGRNIALTGAEIDPNVLFEAKTRGISDDELAGVQIRDFVLSAPERDYPGIVANPPYIRHHRLSLDAKARLKKLSAEIIGKPIDGRAGLHVYFLLRGLQVLTSGGRLAFILPADTFEGVFSPNLWNWIGNHYKIDAVVTFESASAPSPGVDTNAVIVMIENAPPQSEFCWARCCSRGTTLRDWVASGFTNIHQDSLQVYRRKLIEALSTGFSRSPSTQTDASDSGPILGNFARTVRGIATGANDFFFLTEERASSLGLPDAFLRPAVGRTRDVKGEELTFDTLQGLNASGRPTLLFSPDGRPLSEFPEAALSANMRWDTWARIISEEGESRKELIR